MAASQIDRNTMRPDLDSLALFLRAIEHGSLSKAAAESHMVLSAASRRLAILEGHLGVALLNRTSKGVTPTGAGESLAMHARQILRRWASRPSTCG